MNTCFAHIPDLPLPFNHSIENICEMQTCFNGFKLKAGWVNAELLCPYISVATCRGN